MALPPGARLGAYEVVAFIGAGGMARSTKPVTHGSIASSR